MEYTIHIANILYMLSYLMRDILWLRVLTVLAATCLIPYFYFRPDPLLPAIYWNLLFTALNIYWIFRLLLERRPVRLTKDEQRLCQLAFQTLTPREMLKLLKLGHWESHAPRQCFVESGKVPDRLAVIYDGKACIEVNGKQVAELHAGQFVGGTSFITDKPPSVTIVALEPTQCVWWAKTKLKEFLKNNPDLRAGFQRILGVDLTNRLQAAWAHQRADQAFS